MDNSTIGWMAGVMGIMVAYAVCAFIGLVKSK